MAPHVGVRATAQYDAAAALIALKDWDAATRARWKTSASATPTIRWPPRSAAKLALAYIEKGQWCAGRGRVRAPGRHEQGPASWRAQSLWQAAELYEKSG